MKIVMVDDSEGDRRLCRVLLEEQLGANLEFYGENEAPQGLETCRRVAPDCVLLDYTLPGMSGLEFLKHLQGEQPDFAVVMLTGLSSEQVAVDAMRSGAQDYLVKDRINGDSLFAAVHRATEKIALIRTVRQKHAEAEAARDEYQFLADAVPHLIWTCSSDGSIDYVNRRWREFTGLRDVQSLADIEPVVHPDDLERCREDWRKAFAANATFESERRLRRAADGQWRTHLVRAVPMFGPQGNAVKWFGSSTDIDRLKRTESNLENSLAEKEVLLKEVHHRVKNNLQVIASLLRLQSEALPDERIAEAVRESMRRVESMALIHEQLYESKELRGIDLAGYAELLAINLFHSYGDPQRIQLRVEVESIPLGIDQAIPCGLILNELISDAFKHAFPNGRSGRVVISGAIEAGNCVRLEVSDDGVGFPETVDFKKPKSLGLEIVNILARQLGGTLELESKEGTRFRLAFRRA